MAYTEKTHSGGHRDLRTRRSLLPLLFPLAIVQSACVGPVTPFGAIHSFLPSEKTKIEGEEASSQKVVQIRFLPRKQILHSKSDLIVEIHDKDTIPNLDHLKIFFNQIDVTDTFLTNVNVKNRIKEQILEVEFKDVRLKTLDENLIAVTYRKDDTYYYARFESPTCDIFETKSVQNIQGFNPPSEYIQWTTEIAKKYQINPNLLTGIVAQESGFNPNAVSWAKAIGLTQMTDIAQEQIHVSEKNWPQSREIASLSSLQLKQKISNGEINEKTEWRLQPKMSIQGGTEYLQYLHKYWSLDENQLWLKKLPGDPRIVLSQVIIASYNSGPSRVKNAIITDQENWIKKPEMKEAHKYLKKVFSYCFHFSERSVPDDGET